MADSRIKDVLDDILTLVGSGPTGLDGRLDALEAMDPSNRVTTGQETMPRSLVTQSAGMGSSGALRLTYFTARKAESSTQVRVSTGGTAAGATPTLCRVGLYLIAGDGGATLVASIANDTTLFANTGTLYTRSWSAPYAMVMGQRYALGVLVVTGAAVPSMAGSAIVTNASEWAVAPRMTGNLAAQADLAASYADASLATSGSRVYGAIIP